MVISTQNTYQSLRDIRNTPEIYSTNHRLKVALAFKQSLVALSMKFIQLLMT